VTRANLAAVAVLISACSSAPATSPRRSLDAGADGADGAGGVGGPGDASGDRETSSARCDAAAGDLGGAAVAPANGGVVMLSTSQLVGTNEYGGELQAFFYRAGQPGYPRQSGSIDQGNALASSTGCEPVTVGPCLISTNACDPPAPCDIPGAGTIMLGEDAFGASVVSRENPDRTYTSIEIFSGVWFVGGDLLTFQAAGGDVPPFQQDVVGPGCIAMTAPAGPSIPDGGAFPTYTISTAQDLQLAWAGGESGAFVGATLIAGPTNSAAEVSISCSFDASLGQGAVPQQALAALAGETGRFFIYQERRASLVAGSYQLETIARNFGSGPPDAGCPSSNAPAVFQ
jgi:hypothetical protein